MLETKCLANKARLNGKLHILCYYMHITSRKRTLPSRKKTAWEIKVTALSETYQIQPVSINPSNWPPALVCIIILCAISNIAGMVANGTAGKGGGRNKRR